MKRIEYWQYQPRPLDTAMIVLGRPDLSPMTDWFSGERVAPQGYRLVYQGVAPYPIHSHPAEQVWLIHNSDDRPDGQLNRSMSVGDVALVAPVNGRGLDDRFLTGYVALSVGFAELTKEQVQAVIVGAPMVDALAEVNEVAS